MRILVTGASGFIGSNMIAFLKEKGHFVRGVSKSLHKGRRELLNQADELMLYDLQDLKSCLLACESMDYVIHLAADMGGVGYFHAQEYYPFLKNMQIDLNILRAAELMKVKRMFYPSSACAYNTDLQMSENHAILLREDMLYPAKADQTYGWEKFMITHLSQYAPFEVRVGILHTVFGPYQEIEGERTKFPTAIAMKVLKSQRDSQPIEIWGNGKQIRSFIYIDDALEKIYHVLTHTDYPGPVNIGSDHSVTVQEVAEICCDIVGIPPKFTFTSDKPSGVLARNCDNTLFNAMYQYHNKVSTKEGFRRLIEWIQNP